MPVEFISGDLFANSLNVQAFAHGCNCQGSMGAGIAKGFRQRYAEMYEQYRARCKANPRQFNLGDVWLWKEQGKPYVFNLGTQERFWHARASYEAIEPANWRGIRGTVLEESAAYRAEDLHRLAGQIDRVRGVSFRRALVANFRTLPAGH